MSGPALRVVDVDCLYKEGDGGQIAIIPPVINVAYRSGGGGGRGRAGCVRDRHHTRGYPRSPCKPRHHQPLCLPLNITTRNSLWWTHSSVGPRTIETSTLSAILTRAREGLFHKYRLRITLHPQPEQSRWPGYFLTFKL